MGRLNELGIDEEQQPVAFGPPRPPIGPPLPPDYVGPAKPFDYSTINVPPPDPYLGTNDAWTASRGAAVQERERAVGMRPDDPGKFVTDEQKAQREKTKEAFDAIPKEPAPTAGSSAPAAERAQPAAMPTSRVIAAHRDASRNPWSKEGQARYLDAQAREKQAIEDNAATDAGDALRKAAQTEQLAADLKTHDDAARLAEADRQRQAAAQEEKINAQIEDLRASKVDPMKGIISGDSGRDFVTAIGFALGAYLGGKAGASPSENPALRMMDQMIARSVEAQKSEIEAKRSAISGQQNLYQQMRTRFGDERAADLATRIQIREAAALKAEQMAQASGSIKAEQNAALLRSQLDQKNELDKRALIDIPEYRPAQVVTSGGSAPAVKPEERERMFTTEDGKAYVAARTEDAKKISQQQVAVRHLERISKEIDTLRGDAEAYVPGTKKSARLQQLGGEMILAVKSNADLGTLDKGVTEFAEKTFGDPTSLTSRAGQRALDFAKDARKQYEDQVRAAVGEGVARGYVQTPQGVRPAAEYTGEQPKPRGAMPKSFKPGGI